MKRMLRRKIKNGRDCRSFPAGATRLAPGHSGHGHRPRPSVVRSRCACPRCAGRCPRCWRGPRAGSSMLALLRTAAVPPALAVVGRTGRRRAAGAVRRHVLAPRDRRGRLSGLAAGQRRRRRAARLGLAAAAGGAGAGLSRHRLARRAGLPDAARRPRRPRPPRRAARRPPACSTPAAAWATACARCAPCGRRRASRASNGAGRWRWPRSCAVRGRASRAGTCGAARGPRTTSSTCSSGRRAWRARWRRPTPRCAPGSWLVSLEFEAAGRTAARAHGAGVGPARLDLPDRLMNAPKHGFPTRKRAARGHLAPEFPPFQADRALKAARRTSR